MRYWLIKSEPFKWSWDQQVQAGDQGTFWDGVRNHLAKQNLAAMRTGDQAFFYHSNEGKEIVGIVEVIREAYPDPTFDEQKNDEAKNPWLVVDVKALRPLKKPVPLGVIKAHPDLSSMALVKLMRLSVQPVTEQEWRTVLELSKA